MDKKLLEQIGKMCDIILGNQSFNKELDSLALYVGHALKYLHNTPSNSDYAKYLECAREITSRFDINLNPELLVSTLEEYFA